jgi:hypothetical protein
MKEYSQVSVKQFSNFLNKPSSFLRTAEIMYMYVLGNAARLQIHVNYHEKEL